MNYDCWNDAKLLSLRAVFWSSLGLRGLAQVGLAGLVGLIPFRLPCEGQ